jgi:c-di-AMP phosphodiesterase-like protein
MKKLITVLFIIMIILGIVAYLPKLIDNFTKKEIKSIKLNDVTFNIINNEIKVNENKTSDLSKIKDDVTLNYKIVKLNNNPTGIELYFKPLNMLWFNENIMFANTINNSVSVLNLKGELIKNIGKTGNGPVEFNRPRDICSDGNNFY